VRRGRGGALDAKVEGVQGVLVVVPLQSAIDLRGELAQRDSNPAARRPEIRMAGTRWSRASTRPRTEPDRPRRRPTPDRTAALAPEIGAGTGVTGRPSTSTRS
jgi:hypothetical protein